MASYICDYLVVGAGIIGLSIAKTLKQNDASAKILILEKENLIGEHASGRNSGVLHSGVYYPSDTYKARFCKQGAKELFDYASEHNIPVSKDGKLIVATAENQINQIEYLYQNAQINQVNVTKVASDEIKSIESSANSEYGGLYSHDTAVIESKSLLNVLTKELESIGVRILYGNDLISINDSNKSAKTLYNSFSYNKLINCAGAYADRVAHLCHVGEMYRVMPFKGIYYQVKKDTNFKLNGSIYPVPDPKLPFLGIHFTKNVLGKVYVGPTAIPALGRENYHGLVGAEVKEIMRNALSFSKMYAVNKQNFRSLVHKEILNYSSHCFYNNAKRLVKNFDKNLMIKSQKVGIRPQLINTVEAKLEMDYIVEKGENSIHVLNSISPAFTSAFPFSRYVVSLLFNESN